MEALKLHASDCTGCNLYSMNSTNDKACKQDGGHIADSTSTRQISTWCSHSERRGKAANASFLIVNSIISKTAFSSVHLMPQLWTFSTRRYQLGALPNKYAYSVNNKPQCYPYRHNLWASRRVLASLLNG